MENFKKYIRKEESAPGQDEIRELLDQYPWFMTARMISSDPQDANTALQLHLSAAPAPASGLFTISPEEYQARSARQIIDTFLSKTEYRIVPNEQTPDGDITGITEGQTPEVMTEQLAKIYIKQQLWEQAKSAYEKLSLVYPEKSVYFAEIIADIEARRQENNN